MSDLPQPTCKDCLAFQAEKFDDNERILGACGLRPELGLVPENYPWCDQFRMKPSRAGKVANPTKKSPAGAPRSAQRGVVGATRAKIRATLSRPVTGDTEGDMTVDRDGLKQVIREILEEESLYGYPEMGARWQGGELEMKPADSTLQAKSMPIDTLFHKIVMVRDKLRVLEQKINAHSGLGEGEKVDLQQYITRCYGTLTSFNVLFADKSDHFTTKK